MNFSGFDSYHAGGHFIVDAVMPDELKALFFARLYCRGKAMDAAEGDPAIAWDLLSGEYNGAKLVAPRQVHGVNVVGATEEYSLPLRPEADGVFIDQDSDCCASLRFADCTPVVIAGVFPHPWMLLLHSGFVGTMKDITGASVSWMLRRLETGTLGRAWAWIGPGICGNCYSRCKDDPATTAAQDIFSGANMKDRGRHIYFDIQGQIKEQLIRSGIRSEDVSTFKACTCCTADLFYSYRGGDENRRNFLVAGNTTKRA